MNIYALQDPRTAKVRYVGKAIDANRRYRDHIAERSLSAKSKKNSWIKSLKAKGFLPVLIVLDQVADSEANEAEKAFIQFFGPENLTNGTLGGDGGAITDPEARERIRQGNIGRIAPAATREKMSQAHKNRCSSPEERARMSRTAIAAGNTPPVNLGETNNQAKLTEASVRRIRSLAREGLSPREIWNQEFTFVTYQNIWMVATGKTWKHIN